MADSEIYRNPADNALFLLLQNIAFNGLTCLEHIVMSYIADNADNIFAVQEEKIAILTVPTTHIPW